LQGFSLSGSIPGASTGDIGGAGEGEEAELEEDAVLDCTEVVLKVITLLL